MNLILIFQAPDRNNINTIFSSISEIACSRKYHHERWIIHFSVFILPARVSRFSAPSLMSLSPPNFTSTSPYLPLRRCTTASHSNPFYRDNDTPLHLMHLQRLANHEYKGFQKEPHRIEVVDKIFRPQSQYCRSDRRVYKVTGICSTDSRLGA